VCRQDDDGGAASAEGSEARDRRKRRKIMSEPTEGTILAAVRKNAREVVRVRRGKFKGVPVVDVRVWTRPLTPGDEGTRTLRGLTLRPETWAELLPVIQQATTPPGE
jgi:hypothetical protein